MTSPAWPFVITRNRILDWRPIVAPDFMAAAGSSYFLTYEADGALTDDKAGILQQRTIVSERFGELTLVYRRVPATRKLLGEEGDESLKDRVGRPIHLVEGLVLRGHQPRAAADWRARLPEVHALATDAFRQFWLVDNEEVDIAASYPLPPLEAEQPPASVAQSFIKASSGWGAVARDRVPSIVLIGAAALVVIIVNAIAKSRPRGLDRTSQRGVEPAEEDGQAD